MVSRANFGVKLSRPGFGPAAELPAYSQARRRHGGCRSRLDSSNVIRGNRRAAPASARGTGRAAYTKDVRRSTDGRYDVHTTRQPSSLYAASVAR